MHKVRVGLVGSTGMSGGVAKELLQKHPLVDLIYCSSSKVSDGQLKDAEIMFLATPNDVSRERVPCLLGEHKRIIDFSRAFRLSGNAVYGLPEKNRDRIRAAKLVSNPGCYATSIILGLLPIKGLVEGIKVVSVSGISGAGRNAIVDGGLRAYKVGWEHDHIGEMEHELGLTGMAFTPIVAECLERGIVSTINLTLKADFSVHYALETHYSHETFVRIKDDVGTKASLGTNYCDISVTQKGREAVIISALDNLMKGAAGQAVQNMNIMCGFDESAGLE